MSELLSADSVGKLVVCGQCHQFEPKGLSGLAERWQYLAAELDPYPGQINTIGIMDDVWGGDDLLGPSDTDDLGTKY
jgi:hypothetical protein